jgi:dTDP-4-dehydrorhamnose reductase
MKILVCGAGGMLGRDLLRAGAAAGHDVSGLTRAELDVTDAGAVREAIARARPDAVFNCAAWTDVDGAEEHEAEATHVNGEGAGNVAAAAAEAGAGVLYVSSDYVFDGAKGEPYVESDATAPVSAYGRSKLAGEAATTAANPRHFVVRSSWLFGTHGGNFVATMLRLGAERDELRVVDDQVGCPTWTGHLADGLLGIATEADYGIHHLAGGGECSWCDFAREIFRQAGVECEVHPITTSEYPLPATRPAYSVLRSSRGLELPPWQEGLGRYLAERKTPAA